MKKRVGRSTSKEDSVENKRMDGKRVSISVGMETDKSVCDCECVSV